MSLKKFKASNSCIFCEPLTKGIVGINTGAVSAAEGTFGGVKKSGLGREGGPSGLDEFTETKYLCFGGIV